MTVRSCWPTDDRVSMGSIRAAARNDPSPYIRGLALKLDAADAQRIRCIGEGRAKAAARMRRFEEWEGRSGSGLLSPEAWMLHAASLGTGEWAEGVMRCSSRHWRRRARRCHPSSMPALVRRFLRSKAWASLPWQVEP